jgi:sulfoxide reductase heme-binding subunit YedZ
MPWWSRKTIAWVLLGSPALYALYLIATNDLGANPLETLTDHTGQWTLRFLLLGLLITPLRELTGWVSLIRYRRLIGLFAAFYATAHMALWLFIDQQLDWRLLLEDVLDRPYITLGFMGWLLLLPLVATSTKGMIKKLGKSWRKLHRAVYIIPLLGIVHYTMSLKADFSLPILYGVILAMLLGFRVWMRQAR